MATLGHPAKRGLCFAENQAESPWTPLHFERGFATDESARPVRDLVTWRRSVQVSPYAMTRSLRIAALIAMTTLTAACGGIAPQPGLTGYSDNHSTLRLLGSIDPRISAELWVEYVATRNVRACQRVDGESGRVLLTKRLRYAVLPDASRYTLDILLDPKDDIGCDFEPRTVFLRATETLTGIRDHAYVGILGLDVSGSGSVPEYFLHCQRGGDKNFSCSLPRAQVSPGLFCPAPAQLSCRKNCAATINLAMVEPARSETLWALPKGCPATGKP